MTTEKSKEENNKEEEEEEEIYASGFLEKRGGRNKGLRRRWFELYPSGKLTYSKKFGLKCINHLNVKQSLGLKPIDEKRKGIKNSHVGRAFEIVMSDRVFYFLAENKDQKNYWVKSLREIINGKIPNQKSSQSGSISSENLLSSTVIGGLNLVTDPSSAVSSDEYLEKCREIVNLEKKIDVLNKQIEGFQNERELSQKSIQLQKQQSQFLEKHKQENDDQMLNKSDSQYVLKLIDGLTSLMNRELEKKLPKELQYLEEQAKQN
ncbi:hypothetical protein M0812_18107 [Anaeramoeba flamelloides]|uniref:PH domain-containing protein n=1 Tax=Anaeramoeba flamelloides TaxID=1746091 RepID=A0AAV7Z1Y7_9EUKA|nr:hypothetical protein M0812_18107 [Anaeramoeba flamelloides]